MYQVYQNKNFMVVWANFKIINISDRGIFCTRVNLNQNVKHQTNCYMTDTYVIVDIQLRCSQKQMDHFWTKELSQDNMFRKLTATVLTLTLTC